MVESRSRTAGMVIRFPCSLTTDTRIEDAGTGSNDQLTPWLIVFQKKRGGVLSIMDATFGTLPIVLHGKYNTLARQCPMLKVKFDATRGMNTSAIIKFSNPFSSVAGEIDFFGKHSQGLTFFEQDRKSTRFDASIMTDGLNRSLRSNGWWNSRCRTI